MLHLILAAIFLAYSIFMNTIFAAETEEKWNPVSAGPVTTWTAPLCGKGKFAAQPFFFYNRSRGIMNAEGHYDGFSGGDKKYQYQEQLFLQYGITDHFEIDAQTVYQQNYVKQGDLKAHSRGLGDSYLFLRYCPIEDSGWIPHLNAILQVKAPTGKFQKADPAKLGSDLMGATSGGGSWDYGFGVLLSKKIKPFIIHADAVYSFPQEVKVDDVKTKYNNYLNLDTGIEYFLPKGFNLMLEFNSILQADRKKDGSRIPGTAVKSLVIAPGIGWSCQKIQTLLVYQRTLIGTNVDANDSAVLTCVYTF